MILREGEKEKVNVPGLGVTRSKSKEDDLSGVVEVKHNIGIKHVHINLIH